MIKRSINTRIPLESHFANEFCEYQVAEKTESNTQAIGNQFKSTLVR